MRSTCVEMVVVVARVYLDMVLHEYTLGRRSVGDVCQCLDRLIEARRFDAVRGMVREAMRCVMPTPMVLWRWLAANQRAISYENRLALQAAALRDPRVKRIYEESCKA